MLQPTKLCNIYEISDCNNLDGTRYEVDRNTIGQYVGKGEYGEIYEGMELYDEYADENCTIEYDENDFAFRLYYDSHTELTEGLDGLCILNDGGTK